MLPGPSGDLWRHAMQSHWLAIASRCCIGACGHRITRAVLMSPSKMQHAEPRLPSMLSASVQISSQALLMIPACVDVGAAADCGV
jgi:hypothetical protein